jgi:hypothetical protein
MDRTFERRPRFAKPGVTKNKSLTTGRPSVRAKPQWLNQRKINGSGSGANAAEYVDRYKKLKLETARSAIQFYRLCERATKGPPN